jgi:hypothetical protein
MRAARVRPLNMSHAINSRLTIRVILQALFSIRLFDLGFVGILTDAKRLVVCSIVDHDV